MPEQGGPETGQSDQREVGEAVCVCVSRQGGGAGGGVTKTAVQNEKS